MKFGEYALLDEVVHTFKKSPQWWWKIRPATSGDELNISKFLVQDRSVFGADGVRRDFPPTNTEIAHREIALTFAGTNIPMDETKTVEVGGDPLIKVGSSPETIEAVLRQMPHAMILEIWDAIAGAIPGWGPIRPNSKPEENSSAE